MSTVASWNPKVDAYVAKAQPFAQPVLFHLRELVHQGCPRIEETIKWSRPFFEYRGKILCNMSAFKEHCSFGFWGEEIAAILREANVLGEQGMGSLGRILRIEDLPPDKLMLGWLRQAAQFVDAGRHTSPFATRQRVVKASKSVLELPDDFVSRLKKNQQAASVFAAFSPSCKREYIEWIDEAKRAETREKRIETAVGWIAEGKQRNWKYQNC